MNEETEIGIVAEIEMATGDAHGGLIVTVTILLPATCTASILGATAITRAQENGGREGSGERGEVGTGMAVEDIRDREVGVAAVDVTGDTLLPVVMVS